MKKRNMLFGYKVENGQKVIEEKESKIVVEIYTRYLKRETISAIANDLTKRRVEYVPNRYEWNKPRVLRVVKDERYIGADKFPPLIDKSIFYAAQSLNSQKRTIKEDFLDKDVHRVSVPIKCPVCGSIVKRKCDCRKKNPEKWYCSNKDCRKIIAIKDEALINCLIDILNTLIEKNNDIEYTPKERGDNTKLVLLENEIEKLYLNPRSNEENIFNKLNSYFSELYKSVDKNIGKTMRIKNTLKNTPLQMKFSPGLLSSIAEAIKLYPDGDVAIVLINGQEIRR